MIYLVSATQFIFDIPDIKLVSVQESLDVLAPLEIVGLDTETTGLDPYTKELKLVQLGCKDFQVVIDTTTIDIKRYKGPRPPFGTHRYYFRLYALSEESLYARNIKELREQIKEYKIGETSIMGKFTRVRRVEKKRKGWH